MGRERSSWEPCRRLCCKKRPMPWCGWPRPRSAARTCIGQTGTGTSAWTTALFSPQARTITLTGLTTGTRVQVRARAVGGSTGQSDWSMPGSSMVD